MNHNPGGGSIPAAIHRQRVNNAQHVARPAYANVKVMLKTVRHRNGFQTGIGLNGKAVAEKEMTLAEAQKLLTKESNRWGRLITRKIPNIGLDMLCTETELIDNYDYDATDRRAAIYKTDVAKVSINTQPDAPTSGFINTAVTTPNNGDFNADGSLKM